MPLDLEAIRAERPSNEVHYLASVDSTMHAGSELAAKGAAHGTIVIAEEQTAGMGRLGRSWISEAEVGIYCSILLRLGLPASQLPITTLLLGLATADAIERSSGLACDLRWPNDVLINGRKVAGILAQLTGTCVVAGIGINVNQQSLPEGLRTPATSLLIELRRAGLSETAQNRERLIVALLRSLDEFAELIETRGPQAILDTFTAASSYVVNRKVVVEESGQQATTAGLDPQGFLLLRTASGATERLATGGIRPID